MKTPLNIMTIVLALPLAAATCEIEDQCMADQDCTTPCHVCKNGACQVDEALLNSCGLCADEPTNGCGADGGGDWDVQHDASRPDGHTQPDVLASDTNQADVRHVDTGSVDTAQPDSAQPDAAQPDAAQSDTAQPDAAQPDAAQPDAAQSDAAQSDAAQSDAAQADAAQPDSSSPDSAGSCVVQPEICSGMTYCDTDDGICKTGCSSSAQCGDHGYCNTDLHVCECHSDYHMCDDICVSDFDLNSCGLRCNNPCPQPQNATVSCDGVSCQAECAPDYRLCGDACALCPSEGVRNLTCLYDLCVADSCQTGFVLNNGVCVPWQIERFSGTTEDLDMVIDGDDRLYVAYRPFYYGNLGYRHFDGLSWTNETWIYGYSGDIAIDIDPQNRPYISSRQSSRIELRHHDGQAWQHTELPSTNDAYFTTAIAVDSQSRAHIAFVDYGAYTLTYAQYDGSWAVQVVDDQAQVSRSIDLVLDEQEQVHIAYWDDTVVKHAVLQDSWEIELVDSNLENGTPRGLAMAIDGTNGVHIAFGTASALSYAHKEVDTWQSDVIDSRGGEGELSIALGADGFAHISYYNDVYGAPCYTYWDGAAWRKSIIEDRTGESIGAHSALVLNSSGEPMICYPSASRDMACAHADY